MADDPDKMYSNTLVTFHSKVDFISSDRIWRKKNWLP